MPVMQSQPGKYNPITRDYNLPKNAIGSKAGGGYLYSPPKTQAVLGVTTLGGGGGAPQSQAQPQLNQDIQRNDLDRSLNDLSAIVDRDFETAIQGLAQQEQAVTREQGTALGQVEAQGAKARTSLGEAKDVNLQGLATEESTAQKTATSGIRQARDLFREMQQRNISQLSGMGLSSSSVAEALAERLGVETAQRLAGITGSRDEVIQNIAKERTRIQTVYQQKMSDLEMELTNQIATVKNAFLSQLERINQARNEAATNKANRRAELMDKYQSSIAQLQKDAQDFQQELTKASQKRMQSIKEATQSLTAAPTDYSGLTQAIQGTQGIADMGLQREIQLTPKGLTYTFTDKKKEKDDEDTIENRFKTK